MSHDSNDEQRMATAYHEAGHALMATVLGRLIQKVTIAPAKMPTGGQRLGVCQMQKGRSKSTKDWLEDEILILFAGMVAESQFTGRYCRVGAAEDLRMVQRLLRERPGNQRQVERYERRLFDKTQHVLSDESHEQALQWIAEELLRKTTLSGRAVRHFLHQADQQSGKK